jgi:uncharacterized protein
MHMTSQLITILNRQKVEKLGLASRGGITRIGKQEEIVAVLGSPLVKVIVGPRRAGKSTLALQALSGESFAYVNFEDEALLSCVTESDSLIEALNHIYESPKYFLFDEIQNLPDWERFLNRQHRRGHNLIVTGSNSTMLSGELASALTGRHIPIQLFTFSYPEFLAAKQVGTDGSPELFEQWLVSGGYPEVVLGSIDGGLYLKTLFDSVVLRDVVSRHRLRNSVAIKTLAQLMVAGAGTKYTARSLERVMNGLAFSTIQRYLSYLHEAYLLFELQAFSYKLRQRIASERKVYTVDNGILSAFSTNPIGSNPQLLENAVFIELQRKGFEPNKSLFYVKTKSGFEVDFYLPAVSGESTLIQVAVTLSSPLTLDRELRALVEAAKEFKAARLLVITFNDTARYERDGMVIEAIPFVTFARSELRL